MIFDFQFKSSYKASLEIVSELLQGKSFEHLSRFMETLVEKYDKFVKNLHLSFIRYVEKLWDNFMNVLTSYWNTALKNIEPSFMKFMHYMETGNNPFFINFLKSSKIFFILNFEYK